MKRNIKYKNLIISAVIILIIFSITIANIIPKAYMGFILLAIFIFLIATSMYSLEINKDGVILKNFYLQIQFNFKGFSITNVHTFNQGAFVIVIDGKNYSIKATKSNYNNVLKLLEGNKELQHKMEKLKKKSFFSF